MNYIMSYNVNCLFIAVYNTNLFTKWEQGIYHVFYCSLWLNLD